MDDDKTRRLAELEAERARTLAALEARADRDRADKAARAALARLADEHAAQAHPPTGPDRPRRV